MGQKSAFSTDGSRSKTVFRERRLTVESITQNIQSKLNSKKSDGRPLAAHNFNQSGRGGVTCVYIARFLSFPT